jgi:uncharacterized protein
MRSPPRRAPRLAFAAALLAATAACAGARPSPAPAPIAAAASAPRAFLWEVTRPGAPDRPLFLTGSMHAGRPETFALPPSFEAAFARAQALVVELDPERADTSAVQRAFLSRGLYRPPESLSARLDGETRALLPAALERVGLQPAAVDQLRPWALATMLEVLELSKVGFDPKNGLDARLLARARGSKDVVELETAEEQLELLAGLPEETQLAVLRQALRAGPRLEAEVTRLSAAWADGDVATIAEITFEDAGDPALAPFYEALFARRNRAMAEKLAPLAGAPEVHLAVVGAGHLVGDQGLLALLAARGLRVRQLARE